MKRVLLVVFPMCIFVGSFIAVRLPAQPQQPDPPPAGELPPDQGQACVDCHKDLHPRIVSDWQLSKHSQNDVSCQACHGDKPGLYQDGTLKQPESYARPFPDLLTFHDAPTTIEQKLFVMFLEHRMRTFQGAFHNNPDYSLWYGWSAMQRDLTEIKEQAELMRTRKARSAEPAPKPSVKKR